MNTLELLVAQFPGCAYIPMTAAGRAIGYASQTCYNLYHKGAFPLPVRKVGKKSMVSLTELARFMSDGVAANDDVIEPEAVVVAPRRVGRPTKQEVIARRQTQL